MVHCVFSLEAPRLGDSIGNTQHTCTFTLKKIKWISLLYLLALRYDFHSITRTFMVADVFEHRSSTVLLKTCQSLQQHKAKSGQNSFQGVVDARTDAWNMLVLRQLSRYLKYQIQELFVQYTVELQWLEP